MANPLAIHYIYQIYTCLSVLKNHIKKKKKKPIETYWKLLDCYHILVPVESYTRMIYNIILKENKGIYLVS